MLNNNNPGYLLALAMAMPAGLAVTGLAATRPKLVWHLLIIVSIVSSGIMPFGYTFVDEYLTISLLLGILFSGVFRWKDATSEETGRFRGYDLHHLFFSVMMVYMVIQSVRGLIELESLQKIRWVVFFGMLGLLPIVLGIRNFGVPSRRQTALLITLSTAAYLMIYTLHGLTVEFFSATSRWDLQTVWWGTTAYTLLPVVIAMPAIITCLMDGSGGHRLAGWGTLFVVIGTTIYYDSRASLLCICAFLLVAAPKIGLRRLVGSLVLLGLVSSVFLPFALTANRNLKDFFYDLSMSGRALYRPQDILDKKVKSSGDIDRVVHIRAAFNSITQDWNKLLFGYGFRTHGGIISPHLRTLYEEYNLPEYAARVQDDESTEGFSALVVDTGIVGLLLVLANFLLAARQVLGERMNENRYIMLLSLVILFLWLFVINILDITLFYLSIMPSGLIFLLGRPQDERLLANATTASVSNQAGEQS